MTREPRARATFQPGERECVEAVLGYLTEHPYASDTLEGITEWWVMRHHVRVEAHRVVRVLKTLTESGYLEKIGEGENPIYRLKTRDDRPILGDSAPSNGGIHLQDSMKEDSSG